MELLSTLLSALGLYASERNTYEANSSQEFMEWLAQHHFTKLKSAIESHHQATLAVEQLLREDHRLLIEKLDKIEGLLGCLASGIDDLGRLSLALNPVKTLSDQAISILRQLIDSGASAFVAGRTYDGPYLVLIGGRGGEIQFDDERYLDDDLETLARLDVLNLSSNSEGKPMYGITRTAEKVLEAIGNTGL